MEVELDVELIGGKHQDFQFLRRTHQLFPHQVNHAFQSVQQQILLELVYRVHQDPMYELVFNLLLVVGLLDALDGERNAQNCQLYHGLRFKTLYNTAAYPQKMALEIMKSNYSLCIILSSFTFLASTSLIKAVFLGCDFLNPW